MSLETNESEAAFASRPTSASTSASISASVSTGATLPSKPARWLNAIGQFVVIGSSRVASLFYAAGAWTHRTWMHRGAAARGRLNCAVVSVGGLTVGGAGKTPLAAHLASALVARGWRVVLASRGYKGRSRKPVLLVSDGRFIHSSVASAGDESLVLAAHAPRVPVLVGRDRRLVGHHAVSVFDAEIVILDDGFQHHRLARDLNIVCVDSSAGFGNRRTLPAGPLREPLGALRHADWFCVVDDATHWDGANPARACGQESLSQAGLARLLSTYSKETFHVRRLPTRFIELGRSTTLPLALIRGASVGLLMGVARPGSVRRTVEALGARIVAERRFPDHHEYTPKDCAELDSSARYWITTEKDALKILPEWLGERRLWVLQIAIEIEDEGAVLDRLETRLYASGRLARHSEAST